MESKLIAMIVGVALVLATATIYTQSAAAIKISSNGNGVNPCSHPSVAEHNPHCGQAPTGHLKPVESWVCSPCRPPPPPR